MMSLTTRMMLNNFIAFQIYVLKLNRGIGSKVNCKTLIKANAKKLVS